MYDAAQTAEFTIDPGSGLVAPARQCPSPNQDARPVGSQLELIVVHGISLPPGEFGGTHIEALFSNQLDAAAHPYFEEIAGLEVSAHVLVRRDGSLVQFVPFGQRAWHAGQSVFRGRERCNDFSVGIELEGTDTLAYSDAQYAVLAALIAALRAAYPTLTAAPIVGHSDIAPGRKTDPGPAFDWARLDTLQP
ncbi:MAG: 1,6-anhydro-N-acetylmuramyl-L-alanine amidase AmpD [Pseudomonadota bacterium]